MLEVRKCRKRSKCVKQSKVNVVNARHTVDVVNTINTINAGHAVIVVRIRQIDRRKEGMKFKHILHYLHCSTSSEYFLASRQHQVLQPHYSCGRCQSCLSVATVPSPEVRPLARTTVGPSLVQIVKRNPITWPSNQ